MSKFNCLSYIFLALLVFALSPINQLRASEECKQEHEQACRSGVMGSYDECIRGIRTDFSAAASPQWWVNRYGAQALDKAEKVYKSTVEHPTGTSQEIDKLYECHEHVLLNVMAKLKQDSNATSEGSTATTAKAVDQLGVIHRPMLSQSTSASVHGQDATRCVKKDGDNGIHNSCSLVISVVWCVDGDYSDCTRGLDMESDIPGGATITALPLKPPGSVGTVHYSACMGSGTAVANGWHVKCRPP